MTVRRRSRALLTSGALAAALLLGGCATAPGADPAPSALSDGTAAESFAAGGLQDPSGQEAEEATGPPERIRIPSIGVDSVFEELGLGDGGRLDAPVDYDLAGWYRDGVVPGQVGPAIVAGHVDSPTATAVFARIGELGLGDEVIITMADGSDLSFEVSGQTQSAKAEFPTSEVYSNVPAPELRLITCAGDFDSSIGHYLDNLIVFAELRE